MTANVYTIEEDFRSNALFREAMRNFQLGKWEAGFNQLKELEDRYPLEREIRSLRQEMQLRARIDLDEKEDVRNHKKRLALTWVTRISLIWLVLGLAIWGFITYSSWIEDQLVITQQKLDTQVQNLETTVKFNNARSLLQAGRSQEALALLSEIVEANPDYPGLQRYIEDAERQMKLQADYDQAMALLKDGDQVTAQQMLEEIAAQNPNYKDVALQLENMKRSDLLSSVLVKADEAYEAQRWQDAIAEYESLRAIDPNYLNDYVEEQLYTSYIQAAEAMLIDPVETLEALQQAEIYFDKALALRPRDADLLAKRTQARQSVEERLVESYLAAAQSSLVGQADSIKALQKAQAYLNKALELRPGNAKIALQREMAVKYLSAIDAFGKGDWEEAITALEPVVGEEADYADGTARQTLYESYVARGNTRLASGDFELALADFQQAAVLAQQSPDAVLRLFEAQLLVADTLGLLGNYKDAVRLYKAAVDLSGLPTMASEHDAELDEALKKADTFSTRGDYKNSYLAYSAALHDIANLLKTVNVVVESGDYLTMLARRYNTTVSAILAANGISRGTSLKASSILIIPTLP